MMNTVIKRNLKKELHELKKIRTFVLLGENTQYTYDEINEKISVIYKKLGIIKPQDNGHSKVEQCKVESKTNPLTLETYIKLENEGHALKEIASICGVSTNHIYRRRHQWREKGLLVSN